MASTLTPTMLSSNNDSGRLAHGGEANRNHETKRVSKKSTRESPTLSDVPPPPPSRLKPPSASRLTKVDLPHGWVTQVDPASGAIYYVDQINRKSSWTRPTPEKMTRHIIGRTSRSTVLSTPAEKKEHLKAVTLSATNKTRSFISSSGGSVGTGGKIITTPGAQRQRKPIVVPSEVSFESGDAFHSEYSPLNPPSITTPIITALKDSHNTSEETNQHEESPLPSKELNYVQELSGKIDDASNSESIPVNTPLVTTPIITTTKDSQNTSEETNQVEESPLFSKEHDYVQELSGKIDDASNSESIPVNTPLVTTPIITTTKDTRNTSEETNQVEESPLFWKELDYVQELSGKIDDASNSESIPVNTPLVTTPIITTTKDSRNTSEETNQVEESPLFSKEHDYVQELSGKIDDASNSESIPVNTPLVTTPIITTTKDSQNTSEETNQIEESPLFSKELDYVQELSGKIDDASNSESIPVNTPLVTTPIITTTKDSRNTSEETNQVEESPLFWKELDYVQELSGKIDDASNSESIPVNTPLVTTPIITTTKDSRNTSEETNQVEESPLFSKELDYVQELSGKIDDASNSESIPVNTPLVTTPIITTTKDSRNTSEETNQVEESPLFSKELDYVQELSGKIDDASNSESIPVNTPLVTTPIITTTKDSRNTSKETNQVKESPLFSKELDYVQELSGKIDDASNSESIPVNTPLVTTPIITTTKDSRNTSEETNQVKESPLFSKELDYVQELSGKIDDASNSESIPVNTPLVTTPIITTTKDSRNTSEETNQVEESPLFSKELDYVQELSGKIDDASNSESIPVNTPLVTTPIITTTKDTRNTSEETNQVEESPLFSKELDYVQELSGKIDDASNSESIPVNTPLVTTPIITTTKDSQNTSEETNQVEESPLFSKELDYVQELSGKIDDASNSESIPVNTPLVTTPIITTTKDSQNTSKETNQVKESPLFSKELDYVQELSGKIDDASNSESIPVNTPLVTTPIITTTKDSRNTSEETNQVKESPLFSKELDYVQELSGKIDDASNSESIPVNTPLVTTPIITTTKDSRNTSEETNQHEESPLPSKELDYVQELSGKIDDASNSESIPVNTPLVTTPIITTTKDTRNTSEETNQVEESPLFSKELDYVEQLSGKFDRMTIPSTTTVQEISSSSYIYHGNMNEIVPKNVESVIVHDSVQRIVASAFAECTLLVNITIPPSLVQIGERAFYHCSSLKSIVIPDSITFIADGTFAECTSLVSISIPKSVTTIEDHAFAMCSSLESIDFPDGSNNMTTIGKHAFALCTSLKSMSIPGSVTIIKDNSFAECTSLKSVTISDNNVLNIIGTSAFAKCTALLQIVIPHGVTTIGAHAFARCTSLKSIVIPDTVISIGDSAFAECMSLKAMTIPDGVISMGDCAFAECTSLATMTLPKSIKSFGDGVLAHCISMESILIPDNTPSVWNATGTFLGCSSLRSMEIPSGATSIGNCVFAQCTLLESIIIPNGVTSIGENSFHGCTSLKSIIIPDSLMTIGENAFDGCPSDELARFRTKDIPDSPLSSKVGPGVSREGGNSPTKTPMPVAEGTSLYRYYGNVDEDVPKDVISVTVDDSVTRIARSAFAGCAFLESIVIPKSVIEVENRAFYECRMLKSIVIPDSVTIIGNDAFRGCTSLVSLYIPDSVISIGELAFCECTSLMKIAIPEKVRTIEHGVFALCTSLQSITLPDGLTSIGEGAFTRCKALGFIDIPSTVTDIGKNAFLSCESLVSIVVPNSVTSIGEHTFVYCTSLESIVIGISVMSIEKEAFLGCSSLVSIAIPFGVRSIGNSSFQACSSLESVVIPRSVEAIGKEAFRGCTSLVSIEIPDSIMAIDDSLFEGCTSLLSIAIPDCVTSIGEGAFGECTSLISIVIPKSVTSIRRSTFCGCISLVSIVIPDSVTTIDFLAFHECTSLMLITVPESVKNIDGNAFSASLVEYGAKLAEEDAMTWLTSRFNGLPMHKACYGLDISIEKIKSCLNKLPDSAKLTDKTGLYPLFVALLNREATVEVIKMVLEAHTEATMDVGPLGMYPLHFACHNRHLSLGSFELITSMFTRDGRLVLSVPDANNRLACSLAIRHKIADNIILHMFERYPLKASNMKTKIEVAKLNGIIDAYINKLRSLTKEDFVKSFDRLLQNGWVTFVQGIENGSESARKCIELIRDVPIQIARLLAYFKDLQGRVAIESAAKDIRTALEERIFFLGRFELPSGPPLHKSPTSIVLKAQDRGIEAKYRTWFESFCSTLKRWSICETELKDLLQSVPTGRCWKDNEITKLFKTWDLNCDGLLSLQEWMMLCNDELDVGRNREVVLKFMKNAGQFQREVDFRNELSSKYVLGINTFYPNDKIDSKAFSAALKSRSAEGGLNLTHYNYAIAMPLADQDLDAIFRNERPGPDEVRTFAKQLADAIHHVHNEGFILGDLKLQNVVRFDGRLCLIDLDAAVDLKKETFVGAKFSSGILPPEMIAKLTVEQCKGYTDYFKDISHDEKRKLAPKGYNDRDYFVVKSFLMKQKKSSKDVKSDYICMIENKTEDSIPLDISKLPYELVQGRPTIDIWSFGVILYSLHTGKALFPANRDDDLADGVAAEDLFEWNMYKKESKLEHIKNDPLMFKLLMKILSRNPSERYQSMDELLEDPYFKSGGLPGYMESLAAPMVDDFRNVVSVEVSNVTSVDLLSTKQAIIDKIEKSTSVALADIFEATEGRSPTCFVILPYDILATRSAGRKENDSMDSRIRYVGDVLETMTDCITSPIDFAVQLIKKNLFGRSMYLYLVDEWTGEPICVDDVYPLKIIVKSDDAKPLLSLMALGLQTLALANNKPSAIVNMFYPALPGAVIPETLLEKANTFVHESERNGVVKKFLDEGSTTKETVRGNELREFVSFLKENDPDCTFCGLKRICDPSSGKAIWVTNTSHLQMNDADSGGEAIAPQHKVEIQDLGSTPETQVQQMEVLVQNKEDLAKEEERIAKEKEIQAKRIDSLAEQKEALANQINIDLDPKTKNDTNTCCIIL